MDTLIFGLQMTAVGMGAVFLLLAALMVLLMGLGRLDRPEPRRPLTSGDGDGSTEGYAASLTSGGAAPPPPAPEEVRPVVRVHAHGLDDDLLAAITVAVMTHSRLRRRQAAPETRVVPPGKDLRHSRWVALGRTPPPTTRS